MISSIETLESRAAVIPKTIWGLGPAQLHDRFWASRGAQVVRLGQEQELERDAELFLLVPVDALIIFRLSQLIDTLNWLKPRVLLLRVHDNRDRGYQERVITDAEDRFLRFEREYAASDVTVERVAVTPDPAIARIWAEAPDARSGWRELRHTIAQNERATASIPGHVYDARCDHSVGQYTRELVQTWRRPDATVGRTRRVSTGVWADSAAKTDTRTRFIGPVWVGAGRCTSDVDSVVGPAVLWDSADARPQAEALRWDAIEPADPASRVVRPRSLNSVQRASKRAFDVVFSLAALILTAPVYPVVMALIWLEDGRPFFFCHRRETRHGREFPCIKFRSMRNDAEQVKAALEAENKADGPQFYMEEDPRLTRIGRILRATNVDELPQFVNVLIGHMSIVGPRPSPYKENQYCPAWREARLSVRPGITGMWQVYRSREHGLDFQEWIRYDLRYVENMSWRLDLKLMGLTALRMLGIRWGEGGDAEAGVQGPAASVPGSESGA